jgi:hypothetical protein
MALMCLSVLFNKARWLLPIVASHLRGRLAQFKLRSHLLEAVLLLPVVLRSARQPVAGRVLSVLMFL